MKMFFRYILMFSLISMFFLLFVENSRGDTSIFSSLGIGDINPTTMFTSGICYDDSTNIKSHNFVNWADIEHMHYTISFGFNYYQAKTETGSSNFDGVSINGFNLALPFGDGNAFGVSLTPYSLVDISSFYSETQVDTSNAFGEIYYESLTKKLGGINNLALVYAKKINDFSFSTNLSGKFGSINKNVQYRFSDEASSPAFDQYDYFSEYRTNMLNISLGGGIKYSYNNVVSISGLFEIPVFNDVTEFSSHTNVDEVEIAVEDTEWPITVGAGIFYKPNQFSYSAEFLFTNFSGKNIGFYDETEYADFYKLGFSVGYSNYTNQLSDYYKRIKYSLDFAYIQKPYLYNDNNINDLSAMVGIIFPYNNENSSVRIDGGIVQSGDIATNTIESTTFKFGLTLNGSGNWWLRTKRYDD